MDNADHLTGANIDTDTAGKQISLLDYYPYGNTRLEEKAGAYTNDYKYTGKELDEESNLYYYGARYYNATIGRFISQDPWGGDITDPQSFNKYSYVRNNPLKYTDPTGKTFVERMGGFIMGIAESAVGTLVGTLNALLHPVKTGMAAGKQFIENASFLFNYAQNNSASQFASDLQQGTQIGIDSFNEMSEYDKGHTIGSVTEKIMEAAVLGKVIEGGGGKMTIPRASTIVPDYVVTPGGTAYPIPKGAKGPSPVINKSGAQTGSAFSGGKGGANGQVDSIRIMNPDVYNPNGYIKYTNSPTQGKQGVNPYTGATGSRPETHYSIK